MIDNRGANVDVDLMLAKVMERLPGFNKGDVSSDGS